jgi:hypothetical protein
MNDPVVSPAAVQVHGACSMVAQDAFAGVDGEQIVIDADRAPEARAWGSSAGCAIGGMQIPMHHR